MGNNVTSPKKVSDPFNYSVTSPKKVSDPFNYSERKHKMEYGYEVDFLPVGKESKCGDAIAVRFGNLHGERKEQAVVVIDGGFKEDGPKLVDHIRKYYGTNVVDIVISTHPHGDHSAGLEVVLEEMTIGELWMHRPWAESHTNNISNWFTDGRVTDKSVGESLRKSLDTARDLETIAGRKGIPIIEPFVGVGTDFAFGQIKVAGPTGDYYESLLPNFAGTPESKGMFAKVLERVGEFVGKVIENWGLETLDDTGETSAENNTSVITFVAVGEKHLLLTGDAGIPALTEAIDLLEYNDITHENLSFVQTPHHGSKQNIGPTILNRLVGPKLPEEKKKMAAFCSCAIKGEPKHPSKKVANAFKRRGSPVFVTQGIGMQQHQNAPDRNWSTATPLPFYTEIEEDD